MPPVELPSEEPVSPAHLPPDELTLHLIASGLILLVQHVQDGNPITCPYPAALQRGLNRLVIACLRHTTTPPEGIPDLLSWCRRPLASWPLNLPTDAIGSGDRLLDGDIPTHVCDAWACASPDVEAELSERRIMLSAMDICRAAGIQDTYVAFRTLLIQHPVLTALEFQQKNIDPALIPVGASLREAYIPAPASALVDGHYSCCPHCGNLLVRTDKNALQCEEERCRRMPSGPVGRTIPAYEDVVWLKRGLRRFVAAPGRSELRLAERLRQIGVAIELWPTFDRYDLRVLFPNAEAWAVDVKDWANPFLLARSVRTIPTTPSWSRASFVFPDERIAERSDYTRAFRTSCPLLNQTMHALSERDFLKAARKRLRELQTCD